MALINNVTTTAAVHEHDDIYERLYMIGVVTHILLNMIATAPNVLICYVLIRWPALLSANIRALLFSFSLAAAGCSVFLCAKSIWHIISKFTTGSIRVRRETVK